MGIALSSVAQESGGPTPSVRSILDAVVARLPADPIEIAGTIKVRARRGVVLGEFAFDLSADWGGHPPSATYRLRDALGGPLEELTVTRSPSGEARYRHIPEGAAAPSDRFDVFGAVRSTDVSWADLTLSFLWWEAGSWIGKEKISGRSCHIVEVIPPAVRNGLPQDGARAAPYARVRLWIDESQAVLLQAEGFDARGQAVRKLWVRSVKKVNERWMIKDMEVESYPTAHRTRISVEDVKDRPREEGGASE
jgi:hypothetical protein